MSTGILDSRSRLTHPLLSLRLTCDSKLYAIQYLHMTFTLGDGSAARHQRCKELEPQSAKYLKPMELTLWEGNLSSKSVCTILERSVNLQRIALFHFPVDIKGDSQVLSGISKLSTLEGVSIRELDLAGIVTKYNATHATAF